MISYFELLVYTYVYEYMIITLILVYGIMDAAGKSYHPR